MYISLYDSTIITTYTATQRSVKGIVYRTSVTSGGKLLTYHIHFVHWSSFHSLHLLLKLRPLWREWEWYYFGRATIRACNIRALTLPVAVATIVATINNNPVHNFPQDSSGEPLTYIGVVSSEQYGDEEYNHCRWIYLFYWIKFLLSVCLYNMYQIPLCSQEVFNLGPLFRVRPLLGEFSALTCLFVCVCPLFLKKINNC